MIDALHWLGHDGFRIDGPPVVYVDPFQLSTSPPAPPADLILITHPHYDHLSQDDIARIRRPLTVVLGPKEVADKLPGAMVVAPGQTVTVAGVQVRTVPAYNPAKRFHPKSAGYVGYVLTVNGVTYYHAGDTDEIPEMAGLAPDVALLPVSGTYVMTPQEAAAAARAICPKVVVPMHWGSIIGSDADAQALVEALRGSGIQVVVKARE
jgi:L-ascorbate metabolism protein UlaG (beta-lactamase superfamily)